HVAQFGDAPNLKTLAFVSKGNAAVVCALGGTRIDEKKLAAETGLRKPRLASPTELAYLLNARPGGLCCLLVPKTVPFLVDKHLIEKERVLGIAVSQESGLEIAPLEILLATHARIADVCD
ncbi:YbaK/EbsC family protein, partial [archaeon]|nr:YbaK/EbsC family protein [archaeon]